MLESEATTAVRPDGWTAEEIERVGSRAVQLIADHLANIQDRPVFQPVPGDLARAMLSEPLPEQGVSADAILDEFARTIAAYPFGNGHPRFYGWVNSPPVVLSVFADALAAAMNPSVAGGNHAAVYVERQVLEWMKELVGFPRESMGLLVSGGSVAAIIGLTVARNVALHKRGWDVRTNGVQNTPGRLIVYRSSETHGCNQKATELLGIGSANLRTIATDDQLRMDTSALERAIADDKAAGHIPVAVTASAGTVNTGAIDPLGEIADICQKHDVWLHVDAAYGAPAILSEKYGDALSDLTRADSVAVDPHKWLYVPVEAGLVLVRDAQAMRDAFSLIPPYLRTDGNVEGVQGPPWFSEFGIQQTRGFRALKVWMALKYHGRSGYRDLIEQDLGLAEHLLRRVREDDELEVWEPQSLSIVCFRYVPASMRADAQAIDRLNRAILTDIQLSGEAFLSSTVIHDRFWLRACIVNPLARSEDIDVLIRLVKERGRQRLSEV